MKINGKKIDISNCQGIWKAKFNEDDMYVMGNSAQQALTNLLNSYKNIQDNIMKSEKASKNPIPKQPQRRFFKGVK